MPTLTILIGLPGSGKSFYAGHQFNTITVSSDAIREELFGDVNEQGKNNEVFITMFNRATAALKEDKDVVYDATNISRKRRINLIKEIKKAVKKPIKVCGKLIATSVKQCLENNIKRERKVPEEVIFRMLKNFDIPMMNEGFNSIDVVYPFDEMRKYSIKEYLEINDIPHDNPHHSSSVREHMENALAYYHENYQHSSILEEAALLHDIGKFMTKTFVNSKGETTSVAHYYQHDKVGGYLSLFIDSKCAMPDILYRSMLICYHMDPYFGNANITKEEAMKKLWDKFESNLFVEDLWTLHCCDVEAH